MTGRLITGFSAALLAIAFGAATPASAASDGFCRDYAQTAVREVHAAFDSPRCQGAVQQNPARWNPDYHAHYDWCRGSSKRDTDRESGARRAVLDDCHHDGGWRHDDGDHHW